ncbi:MAG: hypothetical protein M5R36_26255 [Deltaproteobacteria bacterium]|nr:hypothetical protein [Deltaproteobacteria bacterium]
MKWAIPIFPVFLALVFAGSAALGCGCGDDDDDDNDAPLTDDDDTAGDDDSAPDDDTSDDDVTDDDDADDDTVLPDDYLAPWPQDAVETRDYDESPSPGARRLKAGDYDEWHAAHHQPDHGGTVDVTFTDGTHTEVASYSRINDSCIWSGSYLGSQALRYWVTGDADAKANAVSTANALHGYLKVTGTTGFIARYWGSQDSIAYGGDGWCDAEPRCHRVESGPYAGDFWWGETSRDQYTGWFFGMVMTYDMVDDEALRARIREDVAEVLHTLMDNYWWIMDEEGVPTIKAPNVIPLYRLAWLIIGYHITGDEAIAENLRVWLRDAKRDVLRLYSFSALNQYGQYYGNNLGHTNWYSILRLGRVYFSEDDYLFLRETFDTMAHTFTRLSHNPWFNGVYMSQGPYTWDTDEDDPYWGQLVDDLADFNDAPLESYYLPDRDPSSYSLDPVSVLLHRVATSRAVARRSDRRHRLPGGGGVSGGSTVRFGVSIPEQSVQNIRMRRGRSRESISGDGLPAGLLAGRVSQVHRQNDVREKNRAGTARSRCIKRVWRE